MFDLLSAIIKKIYNQIQTFMKDLPSLVKTYSKQSAWKDLYEGHTSTPEKKKNLQIIGLVAIVGILTITTLWGTAEQTVKDVCTRILDTDNSRSRTDRKVNVEALPVTIGTMTKRVTAVGHTKASEYVVIKSEVNARIKDILFTEGGLVSKDDVIIRLENDEIQAELQMAEARLVRAKADFARTSKLHEQKFGSSKDFDKDKGALDEAEAQVTSLKAKLEKTVIKAPFSGQIGLMSAQIGQFVANNTELVSIAQTNPMKIDFKIPETYANDAGAGQAAEIKIEAFKDRIFIAHVEAVDSKIETESNSLAIRASTTNDNNELIHGMFANVSLIIGERNNVPMVDESAVLREGTAEYVWVVEKGKAHRKSVRTGVREKHMIEITAGLRKGEIVVISGQARLQADGMGVKVINEKEDNENDKKEEPKSKDKDKDKKTEKTDTPKPDVAKTDDVKSDTAKTEKSPSDSTIDKPAKPNTKETETKQDAEKAPEVSSDTAKKTAQ